MVKIKCQYTGIEFEAHSKRAKNHPIVSEMLSAAHKNGNYGAVIDALEAAKTAGLSTIEEVVEYVNDALAKKADLAKRRAEKAAIAEAEAKRIREERAAARKSQNAHLRENGYHWEKVALDDGAGSFGEDMGYEWKLASPDGRWVTAEQALDEIERGADVVLVEKAAKAAADADAAADAKHIREERAAAYTNARETAVAGMTEVEGFDYSAFEVVFEDTAPLDSGGQSTDKIFVGKISGVKAAVVYHYFGGHDYDEQVSFYCADPEQAGLATSASSTLDDFFG